MFNLNSNDLFFFFLLSMPAILLISILLIFYKPIMLKIRCSYSKGFALKYILLLLLFSIVIPYFIRMEGILIISSELYFLLFFIFFLISWIHVIKASRIMSNSFIVGFLYVFTFIISTYALKKQLSEGFVFSAFTLVGLVFGRVFSSTNIKNPVNIELNVYMPAIYNMYANKHFLIGENDYIFFGDKVEITNFKKIHIKGDNLDTYLYKDNGVLLRIPTGNLKKIDFCVDYIKEESGNKRSFSTTFVLHKDDYGVYRIHLMKSYLNYLKTFCILLKKLFDKQKITFRKLIDNSFSKKEYSETIYQYNSSIFKNNIYYPSLNFDDILNKIKNESNIEKSVAYISGQFGSGKTTLAHAILSKSQSVVYNYQHDHSDYDDLLSDMANDLLGWRGFYEFLKIAAFLALISIVAVFISFDYKIKTTVLAQLIFNIFKNSNFLGMSSFLIKYDNSIFHVLNISIYILIIIIIFKIINYFKVAIGLINFGSGIQTKKIIEEIAILADKKNVGFIFDEIDRDVKFETTYKNLQTISYLRKRRDDEIIGIVNFDEKMLKREQCRYNQFKFIEIVKNQNKNRGELMDEQCVLIDYKCDKCSLLSECKLQQLLKKKYIKIDVNLYINFRKYVLSILLYSRRLFEELTGIIIDVKCDKLHNFVEILLMLDEKQINILMLPIKYRNIINVTYSEAIDVIQEIIDFTKDDILALMDNAVFISYYSPSGVHSSNDFEHLENIANKLGIKNQLDKVQFIEECTQIAKAGIKDLESGQWKLLIDLMNLSNDESKVYISLLEFLSNGFKNVPNSKMQSACKLENFRDLKISLVEYFEKLDSIYTN